MNVVLLTGYAKSGKDTVFKLLDKYYPNQFERYAFADALKNDVNPFLKEKTGLDVWELSGELKEKVRPLLVAYGCMMRDLGDGLHWVRKVESEMLNSKTDKIKVITDARFPNEVTHFTNNPNYNTFVVKVLRLLDDGPLGAPNEEEAKNQPLVDRLVDFTFVSRNTLNLEDLRPDIDELYDLTRYEFIK